MTSFETGKGGTFARFILAKRESKKKSTKCKPASVAARTRWCIVLKTARYPAVEWLFQVSTKPR